jgi:hypothetical protein
MGQAPGNQRQIGPVTHSQTRAKNRYVVIFPLSNGYLGLHPIWLWCPRDDEAKQGGLEEVDFGSKA